MKLILLHGPPAAGKYTVARELTNLTGIELYHNHVVVDAVLACHAFGTPGFVAMRDALWRARFGAMTADLIFTFNPENSVPQAFIDWLFNDLPRRDVKVHSVEITASESTIESRLASAQRQQFRKLTDVDFYRQLRASGTFRSPVIPRTELHIDTGLLAPREAADRIAQHCALRHG